MSLFSCLFDLFKKKEVGEEARKRILTNIKDIRRLFGYPHFNTKEQYAYDTLRYLHKLIIEPTIPLDEMTPGDKELYTDFCKKAIDYSDYVVLSLVKRRETNIEELEEEFIKVNNSRFTSYSMPFEAYQKLKK
jgi:hypothetical protein